MFNIERKLDRIISILYDENLLHWKTVPKTDIIAFAKQKFDIGWTDVEINFILTFLENDGYIISKEVDINGLIFSHYSLTVKGVQIKRNGGFLWDKIKKVTTNIIIVWAALLTILVSIKTFAEYINNNKKTSVNNDAILQPNQRVKVDTIIIHDSAKKPSILPTNK